MKIAFIVSGFPTLSETFIINQITGLIDLGHDVEIFAEYNPNDKKIHPDVYKFKLMDRVHYFNIPRNKIFRLLKAIYLFVFNFHKNPIKMMNTLNFLRYSISALSLKLLYCQIPFLNKKFDIIQCHFGFNGSIGVLLKRIGVKGKIITAFHGFDVSSFILDNREDIYEELFLKGDLFLPVCEHWKKKLIQLNCDQKKIIIHHMGIDMEKFSYGERRIMLGEPVRMLSVGRLVEKKGHEYSIRALAKIVKKNKNVIFTIVGDGVLKEKLKSLVMLLDVAGYVKFIDASNQNEIVRHYNQSHLFVLPSITADDGDQEGASVVLKEAQATGLPVVSTYHGGIPECVLDGQSGFLVPERDVDALTSKIEYLIEHPELWAAIGKAGRDFIGEKFNINTLNKRLIEIYQL